MSMHKQWFMEITDCVLAQLVVALVEKRQRTSKTKGNDSNSRKHQYAIVLGRGEQSKPKGERVVLIDLATFCYHAPNSL